VHESTWENESNLAHASRLLQLYLESLPDSQ
jgi:hypothetical protein